MHNKKLLHEMVSQARVSKADMVLELGAGKGALTEVLVQKAGKVLAVEYDAQFIEYLRQKTTHDAHVKVIHQDILKLHLPKENFIVVSNIPYAITTPIMKMLLNNPVSPFQRGVLIIEKGAAKRFTAPTVKDAYVAAWRIWFDIRYVKTVPRDYFSPPPKVDSAMLCITRKAKPAIPLKEYRMFHRLAEYVLQEPKSSLDIAMKGIFTPPQIAHVKRSMHVQDGHRVESLTEVQWGMIYDTMMKHVPPFRWPKTRNKGRTK
ncbi:ribosomal RNA small subunit methyltransferase A [Paenibacillus dendritiformis]|nr:ribosomal RNA small subunit methyltransferase A [Paenibacillus dendritiformis]